MKAAAIVAAWVCALGGMAAAEVAPLDPYLPHRPAQAAVRIWGDRHMRALVSEWESEFRGIQGSSAVEANLIGNGTGMPGLYLGLADVALFGRDTIVTDNDGFLHVRNYAPIRIDFGNGSIATVGRSPALVIAVAKDNPLARLTLDQVDAIFSSKRFRGSPRRIKVWGDLGISGAMAGKPIHLYGPDPESMVGLFFARAALGGSHRLNWDSYKEFRDNRRSDGSVEEAEATISESVSLDPLGMGVTTLAHLDPSLKAVPLARSDLEEAMLPTRDSVCGRVYPLSRPLFAVVDKRPGEPMDPRVLAFLRFMLSERGQHALEDKGGYLALSPALLSSERARLDSL